jgi:hypothetical protein
VSNSETSTMLSTCAQFGDTNRLSVNAQADERAAVTFVNGRGRHAQTA